MLNFVGCALGGAQDEVMGILTLLGPRIDADRSRQTRALFVELRVRVPIPPSKSEANKARNVNQVQRR